jgi:hypothetical protein
LILHLAQLSAKSFMVSWWNISSEVASPLQAASICTRSRHFKFQLVRCCWTRNPFYPLQIRSQRNISPSAVMVFGLHQNNLVWLTWRLISFSSATLPLVS